MAAPASEVEADVGTLLIVGFAGHDPSSPGTQTVLRQLREGRIAGVLLLARNIGGAPQLGDLTAALRAASPRLTPLVAVDQEGGKVARLWPRHGVPRLPAARDQAAFPEPVLRQRWRQVAAGLRTAGVNLNLAPVVDLDHGEASASIGSLGRALSADPGTVRRLAGAIVEAHRTEGLLTALKHFPGHGPAEGDSHDGPTPVGPRWSPRDLHPFAELIRDGLADTVMVGHVSVPALDPTLRPASLSPAVLRDTLRARLGFEGVIVTDDLQMGALATAGGIEEVALAALRAGADLMIFANDKRLDPGLPDRLAAFLARQAQRDPDLARRIAVAASRVRALRARAERLRQNALVTDPAPIPPSPRGLVLPGDPETFMPMPAPPIVPPMPQAKPETAPAAGATEPAF